LLRASGLSRIEKFGAQARLVLDPAMLLQWDRLNATEQYFNLMEAWLRFGRAEMVGERGSIWGDLLLPCVQAWQHLPESGLRSDLKKPQEIYLLGVGRDFYLLALMDLFGFLEVEQPRRPVTPWGPAAIRHVPFGDAACKLLATVMFNPFLGKEPPPVEEDDEDDNEDDDPTAPYFSPILLEDPSPEEDDDEEEDGEEGVPERPRFGAWQPLFQPYFPEWRENLEFPEPELREGVFIFRVSLGKVWRLIAMPADSTLDDLVGLVLHSVDFDDDHLYEFRYRDRLGANVSAVHPAMDEGPWADRVPIGTLPLEPGQTMQLVYDFGDDWRFTVKLERVEPPGARAKKRPRILESHGKAPPQYPNWDE
jgi:hypothetical protein